MENLSTFTTPSWLPPLPQDPTPWRCPKQSTGRSALLLCSFKWVVLFCQATTGVICLCVWQVDDEVVISTSSYNASETEKRLVTAVSEDGTVLTLDQPLNHMHIGQFCLPHHWFLFLEVSERCLNLEGQLWVSAGESHSVADTTLSYTLAADVALLTRNIKIVGQEYPKMMEESFGARLLVGTYSWAGIDYKGLCWNCHHIIHFEHCLCSFVILYEFFLLMLYIPAYSIRLIFVFFCLFVFLLPKNRPGSHQQRGVLPLWSGRLDRLQRPPLLCGFPQPGRGNTPTYTLKVRKVLTYQERICEAKN